MGVCLPGEARPRAYSWGNYINSSHANYNYGNDANQTVNVGQYATIRGAFLTCREMCGNGSMTGGQIIPMAIRPI